MTDYSQLVRYIERRKKGGFGWKKDYDTEIAGNDYAYLSGHYNRLLDLAIDWIPPALVKEIKEHVCQTSKE